MWYTKFHFQFYFVLTAALTGAIFIRRFSVVEKLIWLILLFNVGVDTYAKYLGSQRISTAPYYNVLLPLEQIITLSIYSIASADQVYKKLLLGLSVILLSFAVVVAIFLQEPTDLHTYALALGGLIVGSVSYLKIRNVIVNEHFILNNIIFWFALANFAYYIVVIPIMSAVPYATQISIDLGISVKKVNNVTYAIWSTLITIGFICSRKKTI